MQTSEVIAALRQRHPHKDGRWATVVEFDRIDFLAVACWQSDSYVVHGYEIKVSRSDWLRELKSPRKADMSMGRCDHWWLAAPAGILKPGELPEGWGYVEISESGRARAKEKAPALRPPMDRRLYLPGDDGVTANRMRLERESFALMARRFVYAEADMEALGSLADACGAEERDRTSALDQAATATGRFTSKQRNAQRSRTAWKRRHIQNQKAHTLHTRAGERHSLDCPLDWCAREARNSLAGRAA